jgi:Secretion system C-terminal sorting domain
MKNLLLTFLLLISLGLGVSSALGDGKIEGKNFSFTLPYPNPANDQVIITCQIDIAATNVELVMHNVLGATVLRKELLAGSHTLELNLENLNPGIYFYSLNIQGQSQFTRRLVIKR